MNRLLEQYKKIIAPALQEQFKISNIMAVPKLVQVNINVGVGKYLKDNRFYESVRKDLTKITGQAPVETKARKSIAGFKVREGQVVGLSVTIRGHRMYDFMDKLISITLPRVKDFRGLSKKGFDGRGNYNLGIKEHLVFPEVSQDSLDHLFGLQVTIVTSAENNEQGYSLLKSMKFPLKD